jgi:hypothetical protein
MRIPIEYKDKYFEICKQWEELTSLELEHDFYKKLFLFDCNNYLAVYTNNKTKCKGRFEFKDLALHKNKSFLIIPKAIYNYFINGIKPEDYLASNTNIFDYCGGVKVKAGWKLEEHFVENREYKIKELQKIVRYYISKEGCKLVKKHNDGRKIQVEAGRWLQTTYNIHTEQPFENYDINLDYYLEHIYKEINTINSNITRKYEQLGFNF